MSMNPPTLPPISDIALGVEIEMPALIVPGTDGRSYGERRNAIKKRIGEEFGKIPIKAIDERQFENTANDFKQWTIGWDESIDGHDGFPKTSRIPAQDNMCRQIQELNNTIVGCGIEIKTPAWVFKDARWEKDLSAIWANLKPLQIKDVRTWIRCSTQVHVSIASEVTASMYPKKFPLDVAKRVAFTIIYFEEAIDELMPDMTYESGRSIRPGGWKNYETYAGRNLVHDLQKGEIVRDLKTIWKTIKNTDTVEGIGKLFGSTRRLKWNFTGKDSSYETIEFRQPPPSREYQEVLDWVTFVGLFINAARNVDAKSLDDAQRGQMSFFAALGLNNTGTDTPRDEALQRSKEARWVAEPGQETNKSSNVGYKDVAKFMNLDDGTMKRLIASRDGMENDLKALKPLITPVAPIHTTPASERPKINLD
ncbi:hypothetical protein F5Y16DRAFT_402524 [Xylariaceae sp. FL0255]|nr:hypothetical protein F5Y16DRAFT_402524 [Xylariaceae sp. FL0255]